jgi:hypothetical protein
LAESLENAYGGARNAATARGTERGFAVGYSAALLGMSPDWVQRRLKTSADPSIESRVSATTGVYERTFNKFVGEGYRYGISRSKITARRYNDRLISEDTVRKFATALAYPVHSIFEAAAQEAEAARQKAEAARLENNFRLGLSNRFGGTLRPL